ncbi:N-acetylmuramic acid 6-phosphate etherase [Nocardia terpenica]|uniref:N-acetylmuramic acid 6-phosphate etherase n=1 Tax=Nocardia terpenica TaxID=455432 RepID=UPI001894C5C3|nr:N-acetylmuramic acid 6-phosphate etherase [Nocardia terpenica]MBF6064026.1 N-acetylmuramic acid 6-phosphate etherase [Nocardia terpenica]MBF6107738.1 N-acetylmuramic acid 6-phosphate etherase [Nocardia terpenica]MBF6114806.1 N-acetylmuramic acid 6-phosphate etherase [Nocardia terpenica]MBF6121207.1 N-acetylmuramic acid 6-phosphate etherase [Nocardia terpenica]MBF6153251.1 N-acetylmuramic acid 6-phosphate etherase [Nocardia terpenica]
MSDIGARTTETPNPRSTTLDTMPVEELLRIMNAEDALVAPAVAPTVPDIARAVELIVAARARGGRLIYVGAGTSGRLGVLDAAECPPTFGTDPSEVVGLIAGGAQALTHSVEGAEDDPDRAAIDLAAVGLIAADVVVALAASGRTPYAIGALRYARSIGAGTVAVSCNRDAELTACADIGIEIDTGPEILTGSTRLKAGTAQKLVCNMLSTAVMVRSGKVYGNLMVDMVPSNSKLVDRARRIVAQATGVDCATAAALLDAADGHPKTAIVMHLVGVDATQARHLLAGAGGFVRRAVPD